MGSSKGTTGLDDSDVSPHAVCAPLPLPSLYRVPFYSSSEGDGALKPCPPSPKRADLFSVRALGWGLAGVGGGSWAASLAYPARAFADSPLRAQVSRVKEAEAVQIPSTALPGGALPVPPLVSRSLSPLASSMFLLRFSYARPVALSRA